MYSATSTNILAFVPGALYERHTTQHSQSVVHLDIPEAWNDLQYRQATLEAELEQGISWQVRINREERGWKQLDLGKKMGTGQSAISKLENPEGGDIQLSTLIKAAHAFDCALLVRFVSYSEFKAAIADVRPDRLLACDFASEKDQPKFIYKNDDNAKALFNSI